jgi:hypothetical protein
LLALPYGLGAGFCEVWIPFALTRAGFPVALTASIVAVGIGANVFRFLYAPVIDATLTLRRWYLIGLASCVVLTVALGFTPLARQAAVVVTIMVFTCQVSTTLVMNPVGAMMATTVDDSMKGRAGGWCQAGNLGGRGISGAAIWVSTNFSNSLAGLSLGSIMAACALGLFFVAGPAMREYKAVGQRLRALGRDLVEMARSPISRLVMALCASPIGVGAAMAIWPAIAIEWNASANRVALDTGVLSAIAMTAGCVVGGQVADRLGRWWSYFGAGTLLALFAVPIIAVRRAPLGYDLGVLGYAFLTGMGTGAWCAMVLYATGRTAAATKYAVLGSIGNLPNAYMTWLDGWIHDRYGVAAMFGVEAIICAVCVALGLWVLRRIGPSESYWAHAKPLPRTARA